MAPDWRSRLWLLVRRHVEVRDIVIIALLLLNFLFTAAYVNGTESARQAAQQVAAQQGRLVEARICSTIGQLAALKPPAGNPETNPSRKFDDRLHATLDGLGPDLGCP